MADKQFVQDGKQYRFKPGENGSLTAPVQRAAMPLVPQPQRISKVVPALKSYRKKYRNPAETQSAAVRG